MSDTSTQNVRPEPTYEEMERLFVNNAKLSRIEKHLNRFNPIKVMKMERMEIRHSAILAWLLNPKETHGLGDGFLRSFLGEALRGDNHRNPTALDVSQSDMRDAEVRCEWHNIDIFILSPKNRWAFIIENKFYSSQHQGQLEKYRERIVELFRAQTVEERDLERVTVSGIFLTLNNENPEDNTYTSIRYERICHILRLYINGEENLFTNEVKIFLRHYLDTLEEATGMSVERTEMEKLARQLYRDHKKVLDFVIEHGASSDFAIAAHNLFGEDPEWMDTVRIDDYDYVFGGLANHMVSFLPKSWHTALRERHLSWPGCEGWWSGYPVIAWLQIWNVNQGTKGQIRLYAEVGPLTNHEFRKSLIEKIKSVPSNRIRFQSGAADEGKQFSKFLKDNSLEIKDIHDADEVSQAIRQLLRKFRPEFDSVASVLSEFTHYGEPVKLGR